MAAAGRLLQEPRYEFLSCRIVILARPEFARIGIFVVKPGIDHGNYCASPVLCRCHHDSFLVFEQSSGRGLQRNPTGILHVERVWMWKDRATAAYRDIPGLNVIT